MLQHINTSLGAKAASRLSADGTHAELHPPR
jgi:hypothetical protein